eukprot:2950477-Rhodomonas_salina.2
MSYLHPDPRRQLSFLSPKTRPDPQIQIFMAGQASCQSTTPRLHAEEAASLTAQRTRWHELSASRSSQHSRLPPPCSAAPLATKSSLALSRAENEIDLPLAILYWAVSIAFLTVIY